jgi:hypothetical protein
VKGGPCCHFFEHTSVQISQNIPNICFYFSQVWIIPDAFGYEVV